MSVDENNIVSFPPVKGDTVTHPDSGLTLTAVADAKHLPVAELQAHGCREVKRQGAPRVEIPYFDEHGVTVAVRYRLRLAKEPDGRDARFLWRRGDKAQHLYGADRLPAIRALGWVLLVEGESDCWTGWHQGLPVLGVPGKACWKSMMAEQLTGLEVYVWQEPEAEDFSERIARDLPELRVIVAPSGIKDLSEAHVVGQDVAALIDELRETAVSIPPDGHATVQPPPEWLLRSPDILVEFVTALHAHGVVGEDRFAKIVYLCATSRVLERPVSLVAKGPSSAGKSFTTAKVLEFFPGEAYYTLTAMSEHALAYSTEPLSHRMLVLYEAAGLEGDFASYLIRSLLSEGRIRYETVEKVQGEGLVPRLIEREGPTGLIVTTTAVSLHPENETRLLSVPANDTPEQTRQILRALACADEPVDEHDLEPWRQLQRFLAAQDNRVFIPYGEALSALVPPIAVRLRRDFATVLSLIRAHALLHQASRKRDERGRVLATLSDYAVVRELVADLIAGEIGASVPETVTETVQAVAGLAANHEGGITYLQLGQRLGIDKSSASRRAKVAISRGYLRNLETRRGQPAELVLGEPLPAEVTVLPSVERLTMAIGCTVADAPGGIGACLSLADAWDGEL